VCQLGSFKWASYPRSIGLIFGLIFVLYIPRVNTHLPGEKPRTPLESVTPRTPSESGEKSVPNHALAVSSWLHALAPAANRASGCNSIRCQILTGSGVFGRASGC